MADSNYPDIITRWNDPNKNHDAIIINPPNSRNDLILTSRVFVQSFWNLQKHEYHYIAENGSYANNVYCDMHVVWAGPNVNYNAPPTAPKDLLVQSWFSPQKTKASVNVDAIAGRNPFTARRVVAEGADAYVPWNHSVWKILKDIPWDLIKKGVSLTSSLMIDTYELVKIESYVISETSSNEVYSYSFKVINSKEIEIKGMISKATFSGERISFEVAPGGSYSKSFESKESPGEIWAILEAPPLPGIFPIALLIPKIDAA